MSDERPIVNVKHVIHNPQEDESAAHTHKIIWKDGGVAEENGLGQFDILWSDGGWVRAEPQQQRDCRSIVKEADTKFHPKTHRR